ncbi:MAG: tRNA 2-thiouridine(34) synthase MnmA, partial [Gemmatimonadota bacterium]|nr:tRNA 2-thiouridine(34) synthase MnmA [Gemmatimonadota bacterium]
RMLTPVGDCTKTETRAIARRLGLVTADKEESVEICFVPDGDYVGVLRRYLPADHPALSPGPIRTAAGEIVGEHDGYAQYTLGQRKRLPGGFPEAMFVVAIEPDERAVVVGTGDELLGRRVVLGEVNWLTEPLQPGDSCDIQVRYRARAARANVVASSRPDGGLLELELSEPVRAITPGQSGALYDGTRLLGGGVIG